MLCRVETVPLQRQVGDQMRRRFHRGDRVWVMSTGALGQQPGGTCTEQSLQGSGGQIADLPDGVQAVSA